MIKKRLAICALVLSCVSFICERPQMALAATKPIQSVSVKVTSKLQPGQDLPDIQTDSSVSEGEIGVSAGNSRYSLTEAEWIDSLSGGVNVADEPRMKVTLEPEDVSEAYFLASYKSSDVKISGGSFVSARREGDSLVVTLRINGVKGDFSPPEDAYWNEKNMGEARWEKADFDSGYYEVTLYRNGKRIYSVDKTSARNYNFYPYMTESGDYTFKVRTVPSTDLQKKYGGDSDWIESGELNITDRYVSDGKGQKESSTSVRSGTAETVGWVKDGTVWRYRYPDGNLARGGWGLIDGFWYYFDMNASMMTGWQDIGGYRYLLFDSGQMAVGWIRLGDKWYYFLPFAEGNAPQGSMAASGWKVIGPYYYYFNADGTMYIGWLQQNGHWYYLNTLDNSLQGAMFTGWFERDGKTYYTNSRGEMVEGWWQIDGRWYYFYPGSGEMARNAQIAGFYVGADGVWNP